MAAAEKMADRFIEYGATSVVDAWSDDVPEGKVNSFHTAVLKKPGEDIVFSWINWKGQRRVMPVGRSSWRTHGWATTARPPWRPTWAG